MNPLWIVLLGVTVVVSGILVFRLHSFLSLLAGAVAVAVLTPQADIYRFSLRSGEVKWEQGVDAVHLLSPAARAVGTPLVVLAEAKGGGVYRQVATLIVSGKFTGAMTPARIVAGERENGLLPGDIVVTPAAAAGAAAESQLTIGKRIAEGFGAMALDIGILIAMAAVLGNALMESGAAERIVLSLRGVVGESRASLAFLVSGFVLAAVVLSDTTFYLLIPLARVMRARSGKDYTLYVLSIVAGAVMTHSLVPPAAGPVAVASELHVDLGLMIFVGAIVGGFAALAGYAYAVWANGRWDIPLRPAVGISEAELERVSLRDEASLPPLWLSLMPIVLPVVLITAGDIWGNGTGWWNRLIATLGEKNIALMIAATIGLLTVWKGRPASGIGATEQPGKRGASATALGHALASAGVMILIISAGGAFGFVVRQMDISARVQAMLPVGKLAILPLAFLLATAVRTAQGSSMVAMITAAGMVSPIVAGSGAGGLGYHPVYLAAAIGCGSKPISWMNDAGFWIISKMSGMTETETLKTVSVMLGIMAVVGLGVTLLGAWLFPLV